MSKLLKAIVPVPDFGESKDLSPSHNHGEGLRFITILSVPWPTNCMQQQEEVHGRKITQQGCVSRWRGPVEPVFYFFL